MLKSSDFVYIKVNSYSLLKLSSDVYSDVIYYHRGVISASAIYKRSAILISTSIFR